MIGREDGPQRLDAATCLVVVVLCLLFVGFVKGIVDWPVDLTFVVLCILLILLMKTSSDLLVSLQSSPKTGGLLFLFFFYLSLRFLPAETEVGLLKLAHLFIVGLPVFFAGILIGRNPRSMRSLVELLMVLGALASFAIFVQSALYGGGRQGLWTGGYQLTGVLIGLGMISAAIRGNTWLVAFAALGLALCGNVGGSVFSLGICSVLWVYRGDFRRGIVSVALTIAMIASFAFAFQPPVLFTVVASKLTGVTSGIVAVNKIKEESRMGVAAPSHSKGLRLPEGFDPKAKTEAASADRVWLYLDAIRLWRQSPWVGGGFGALRYLIADYVYPHNIFLELLAETGALGFLLFGAFLAALISSARRLDDHLEHCAFAAFLFMLSMVGGDISSRMLWFGLGLLFAARFDFVPDVKFMHAKLKVHADLPLRRGGS
jgi:O-antigen ligase